MPKPVPPFCKTRGQKISGGSFVRSASLIFIVKRRVLFGPGNIAVEQLRIDMPLAPAQQPVQGACLADSQVRPTKNAADQGNRILAFKGWVMNFIQVPVDVTVEVFHIGREASAKEGRGRFESS